MERWTSSTASSTFYFSHLNDNTHYVLVLLITLVLVIICPQLYLFLLLWLNSRICIISNIKYLRFAVFVYCKFAKSIEMLFVPTFIHLCDIYSKFLEKYYHPLTFCSVKCSFVFQILSVFLLSNRLSLYVFIFNNHIPISSRKI